MNKEGVIHKDLEGQLAKLLAEKNDLFNQLQNEKSSLSNSEEKIQKLSSQKNDLERQVAVRSQSVIFLHFSLYSELNYII